MPGRYRGHYSGDYQRRAKAVRDAAYANPDAICWRCRLPLGDDEWDAGHLWDSDPDSPLAAEHRRCNRSHGAAMGNRRRAAKRLARTRDW